MMPQSVCVALTMDDGSIRRLQIFTELDAKALPPDGAKAAGFTLSKDGKSWKRDATDAVIKREAGRCPFIAVMDGRPVLDGNGQPVPVKVAGWRRVAGTSVFPVDFPESWRDDGSAIVTDMKCARDIWRERMRKAREAKLAALDIEYQRADESGDAAAKKTIATKKQALRDVTKNPAIDKAASVDALKACWPAILA